MKVRKMMASVSLLLLALWGSTQAASVSWTPGEAPPAQWSIAPASPTVSDLIRFTGPSKVYPNSCEAERNLGGTPQVLIDSTSKVILLWFQGPVPSVCPAIYLPVCGLEGEFGPLAAGDWLFTSLSKELSFEIRFTVQEEIAYHVDADAPGPAHDGRSWATAFLTLQDALAVAASGDEILVAEGVYKPDRGGAATLGDRAASFVLTEGLLVRGGFAGYGQPDPDARNVTLYETVLSGDLNADDLWNLLNKGDNSYHVVTGPDGVLPARLDGFSIVAGQADGLYPHHYGGGLYHLGGSLDIANTTFRNNTAIWGGGIINFGAPMNLVNCQLIGNRALALGGGLYNYEGSIALHNCRLVGNTAGYEEVAGGAAIYNLDGVLKVLDCTLADNRSPNGATLMHFGWGPSLDPQVTVANSILFNGGAELWSNNPAALEVTYSDVQGGWAGAGNVNVDPQFAAPGGFSIEGEWIDGDYRLLAASPVIDVGSDGALPADLLDLDGDGDVAEPIPFDLDNEPRIEGTGVDLGAYEQLARRPPVPSVVLTVCYGTSCITLSPDPNTPNAYVGNSKFRIDGLNFRAKVDVIVTATSPAGGKWSGGMVPDIIGPGSNIVTDVWIRGEGLDLLALPPGSTTVQAAEMELQFSLAP